MSAKTIYKLYDWILDGPDVYSFYLDINEARRAMKYCIKRDKAYYDNEDESEQQEYRQCVNEVEDDNFENIVATRSRTGDGFGYPETNLFVETRLLTKFTIDDYNKGDGYD